LKADDTLQHDGWAMRRRNRQGTAIALAALAALTACTTVGPDFKALPLLAPSSFKAAGLPPALATGLPQATAATAFSRDWWTLFDDPKLNALEQQAMSASRTLAAAEARTERSRALLAAAGADAAPRLSADASAQRLRTSSEVATAPVVQGRRVSIKDNQFSGQGTLNWELDFWGRVRRQNESAQAQLDAATLDSEAARVLLSADVASGYLQLRSLDDELRVLDAATRSRSDALAVAQTRSDAGATTDLDLQRARTELANAEADASDLRRRRAIAENNLAWLTGQPPGELRVTTAAQPLPALPPVAAGLPGDMLQRRPDVAQSLALLHAASAQIGVAQAAFYPTIRLTGYAGLASADLGSLLSAPARIASFGPSFSLPILDGGRNQANLDAAHAAFDEARANFQQRLLTALREVDDALADLQFRRDIGQAQQRAIDAASRAARVARIRYDQGASSYLEVTDSERSLLAAERALAQTRAAQWASTVQLVKVLGGGWQPVRTVSVEAASTGH
jgi:multidrug efflux system outer membrane protein